MSDEEYYQALDKVNELNDVWQHRPSGQIGELLFTALENLTLSDSDVEDMAARFAMLLFLYPFDVALSNSS